MGKVLDRRVGWLAALWVAGAAAGAQAECRLDQIAAFPVTVTDSQPMTPVKLNGVDALMLVDSGAFFSVLSPGYAAQLKLRLDAAPYGVTMRGVGGDARIRLATVRDFTLAGTTIKSVDFIVGGSEVSGAAGLIGQNVLHLGDVDFDLTQGMVRLVRPSGCGGLGMAYWSKGAPVSEIDIRATTPQSMAIVGTAFVNGARIHVMLDSGAQTSILSLDAAARAGVKPDSPDVKRAGYSVGVGRAVVETWTGPFDSFKIGGEEVKHTRLRFGDIGLGDVDMLLGADFLLSHHVYAAFSQNKLYFTYNGGAVFDTSTRTRRNAEGPAPSLPQAAVAGAAAGADEPADAESFSRRGAALASRGDDDGAIADFGRAMALKPDDPRFPLQRAQARLRAKQRAAALGDLDTALTLKPDDVQALILRAELRLDLKDRRGAGDDLAAASKAAAPQADERLALARLESETDHYDAAQADADLWIAAHRDDPRYPAALTVRCSAHAFSGESPDKALQDCDAAVAASPNAAGPLASRAIVQWRRGQTENVVADADAALRLNSGSTWSLYMRGLAKLKRGDKAGGDADVASALGLAPRIALRAKAMGLVSGS